MLYTLDDTAYTALCEKHAVQQTIIFKTCDHCGDIIRGIGVVQWKDYPMEEVTIPLHEEPLFMNEQDIQELMEKSTCEKWCKKCINDLLAQAERGEVKVFDFITMDTDE